MSETLTQELSVAQLIEAGATAAQAEEIVKLRAERLRYEGESAEAEKEAERLQAEMRSLKFTQSLTNAVANSGLLLSPVNLAKLCDDGLTLKGGFKVSQSADGVPTYEVAGRQVDANVFLEALATQHDHLFDVQAPVVKAAEARAAAPKMAKSDFVSPSEKASAIASMGLAAWEALPAKPLPAVDGDKLPSSEEWSRMPARLKAEFIAKHGQDMVLTVLRNVPRKK